MRARLDPGVVGIGTSIGDSAARGEDTGLADVNRRLTFGRQLFLRLVHATVGVRAATFYGCGRIPRVAWTVRDRLAFNG